MNRTVLCVAETWAAGAYLRSLTEHWLGSPPGFEWSLVLSSRSRAIFGDAHPALARETASSSLSPGGSKCDSANGRAPKVMLISAGGTSAEFNLVRQACQAGTTVLQYLDNWYGYRRRLVFNDRWVLPDRLLVADKIAVEEAIEEGVPPEILLPVGQPVWEDISPLPPTDSKSVLFISAPVRRDYSHFLGYTEDDVWELLNETVQSMPALVDRILYAPHPDAPTPNHAQNVEIVRYNKLMLVDVSTVIGMFSSPMVDAHLAGRRVISLQPTTKPLDMCPLSRHGRIPRATTRTELEAALVSKPGDPRSLARSLSDSSARVTAAIEDGLRH